MPESESSFDLVKFNQANITDRTANVPVPELKDFFGEDSKESDWVFTVKALEGVDMARAKEAQVSNKSLEALVEGILSNQNKEKVDAVKEAFNISQDTAPDDYVYRKECIVLGLVKPKMDEEQVVRLIKAHAIILYKLSNKIIQLTGMGMMLGE